MVLEPPSAEQLARIYSELDITPESIDRDVRYLQEWITLQPHLPDIVDERRLKNLIVFCKNSVEKVKRVVDLYYTVRGQLPEFYENRDPLDPDLQKSLDIVFLAPLPRLTPDGSRVLLFRLFNSNPALFNPRHGMKQTFMSGDIRLLEDTCRNDIVVFDLRGFTMAHLASCTISLVRKFMFCAQKAFPIRQKAVHLIYSPPFVDKIMLLFRPFLTEKLAKRFYIHCQGLGNLFDHVPRSVFPEDYGGDMPPLKEIHDSWKNKLGEYRDFFLKEEKVFSDESKRPGKPKRYEDLFGVEGTFRSLAVD